jgi:septum formation protein
VSPDIDESELKKERPHLYSKRIALQKALKVQSLHPEALIITADTVICLGTRILHKAENIEDARKYLNLLSGRQHRCYTSICLVGPNGIKHLRQNLTMVKFKSLHQDEIENYLLTNEWIGCAGGYTITGYAGGFIKSINGSYSSIAGLPLYETRQLLLNYIH